MNTPAASAKIIATRLNQVRDKLEQRLLAKRQLRLEPRKANVPPENIPLPLSPLVGQLLLAVMNAVQADRRRLLPPTPPVEGAPAPTPHGPVGPALQELLDRFLAASPLLPEALPGQSLPPQVHGAVLAFLTDELAFLSDTTLARPPTPAALLLKVRQATTAYAEGRVADSVTILKNALNGDPHNQTLLACLSQLLYGLVHSGSPTVLPEARDYAQRSMIASETQRPLRLERYQYLALVTELAFSEDRTLEWLRSSDLLNPTLLQGHGGLMGHHTVPLRAWGILAAINSSLWNEHDLERIAQLQQQVIGGGALYLHWLRPGLQLRLGQSKTPEQHIISLEENLTTHWHSFEQVQRSLTDYPYHTQGHPWFVKLRYLNTLTQLMPGLAFDILLCHVSLDAQSWHEHAYPQRELQGMLEDYSLSYWRLWSQSLSANKDQLKLGMFPAEETKHEAELIPELEAILELFRGLERQLIRADLWDDLKPWLTRWQPEHLLAAATGSNQPRNRFVPSLTMFKNLYRRWQEPLIQSLLPSELITETARRGGFASLHEAVFALEGALRLVEDRVHGLAATQRRAFQLARKQYPGKFAGKSFGPEAFDGTRMMRLMIPLGLLGAILAAFMLSNNLSQAFGISLALVGLGGVLLINLARDPA